MNKLSSLGLALTDGWLGDGEDYRQLRITQKGKEVIERLNNND